MLNYGTETNTHKKSANSRKSQSWFAAMVERGAEEKFSGFFCITPTIAREILSHNADNRNIVQTKLQMYVEALERGNFSANGESIIIAKDGQLNDGQHRLLACVKTGISFETNVVFGVDRDTRYTVDTGAARSNGTMLHMHGIANSNTVATSIGHYLLYKAGLYTHVISTAVTAKDEIAFYRRNAAFVDRAMDVTKTRASRAMGASALAASYMILCPLNPTETDIFFHKLVGGADLTANDPILVLRNKLLTVPVGQMRNHIRIELILRTWNSYRLKNKRHLIRSFGAYPEKLEV